LTAELSPGGRLDAGAAAAQVPQQEKWSFPLADVIAAGVARVVCAIGYRHETAADVRRPRP